jgi:hypothetical protein
MNRKVSKVTTSMSGGWSGTPKYTSSYKNKIRFSDNCFIDFYISRSSLPVPAGQPRVRVRESDESLEALRLLLHYNKAFGFLNTDFNLHLYSEIVALDATNDTVEKAVNVAFDQLMNDCQQQAYDTVQRFRSRVQAIRKTFDESIG